MKVKKTCPQCTSKTILPIVYGEIVSFKKNVYYGGCEIDDNSPKYICNDCKHTWGVVST